MIPHFCQIKHDPPHSYGDCLRASIASILDIEAIEDVPHFADKDASGSEMTEAMQRYLAGHGLRACFYPVDGVASFNEITGYMHASNPGIYYLVYGRRDDGEDHVIICKNNKKVHDTAWYPMPLTKPMGNGYWLVCTFVSARLVDDNPSS